MRLQKLRQTVLTTALAALCASAGAFAEPISRSNWVPNVGVLNFEEGEQPLGDLWTFECPSGGRVNVSVDTKDDTDTEQADIDPVLLVVDGEGNLLEFADDNAACTYEPVCGFACPSVTEVACGNGENGNANNGNGEKHSVIVRDFGASGCQEGGGYELKVEVFRANGSQLSKQSVGLGGGPAREVPKFALDLGKAPVGPALDDEDVPQGLEFVDSGSTRTTVSPETLHKKQSPKK